MPVKTLHQTITNWIEHLDHYKLNELQSKPSPASWSLGQLYFHLIANTRYYIEEAKTCLSSEDHQHVSYYKLLQEFFPVVNDHSFHNYKVYG